MIPSPLELQHQHHKDGHQYQIPEQLNGHPKYDLFGKYFSEISTSNFTEKNLKDHRLRPYFHTYVNTSQHIQQEQEDIIV